MTAPRLAWGSAALAVLVLVAGWGLSLAGSSLEASTLTALVAAIVIGFAGVGALIASRHPGNLIGWLFCGIALAGSLMSLSRGYAEYWLDGNSASTTLGRAGGLVWRRQLDSRDPPRRDVPPAPLPERALAVATLAASRVVRGTRDRAALRRRLHRPRPPGGLPGGRERLRRRQPLLDLVEAIGALLLLVALVGSPLSLVLRYPARRPRRAPADQVARAGGCRGRRHLHDRPRLLGPPDRAGRERRDNAQRRRAAGRGRRRDPAPPPLRHRRRDQPDAGLRRADGDAGGGLRRERAAAAARVEPVLRSGDRRLHPRGRGAVPARSLAYPGARGPALLPAQVRRAADARGLRCSPPRRGRAAGAHG